MRQVHWTLESSIEVEGVGVHTGALARVRVGPARWGHGIRFYRWGTEEYVPALVAWARAGEGSTVLEGPGFSVRTPEHLLAALYGSGISHARIEIDGPEVPILDGSAREWCERLDEAGSRSGPRQLRVELRRPVRVEAAGGWAEAWPAEGEIVRVDVDFEGGPVGVAQIDLEDEVAFIEDVAWARTFVHERDVERLRAAGRGLGATLDNTVVYGPDGPINAFRSFDEGVRHKLLDLIGDLALAGAPVQARIVVHRGSHALHQALVREVIGASRMGLRGPW